MTFTENQVKHSLIDSVLTLLGEEGAASSNFKIVEYDEASMSGIIRSTHKQLDALLFTLTLVKDVQGKTAWCQVLGVSGTIKACKEKHAYKPKKEAKPPKERLKKKPSEIIGYAQD